jgi:hypothetical protein
MSKSDTVTLVNMHTDDEVAQPDVTPMSSTSFLPAQSQTPSKLDDNTETARQWSSFSVHYKGKAPKPQDMHVLAWRPVGELAVAPQRNEFARDSSDTFSGRLRPTTMMEIFQLFFATNMFVRIIECTNEHVQMMLHGRIPRPNHLRGDDKWPPQWARSWRPLDYRSLCLLIPCCVARSIVGVKERYAWSTATFVSIPGITTIMCRDRYLAIKSALCFQLEDESASQQNLHKIGLLLDHFRNACKTVWNPRRYQWTK